MHITNLNINFKLTIYPSLNFLEKSINVGKYVSNGCNVGCWDVSKMAYFVYINVQFSNCLGKLNLQHNPGAA